MAREGDELAVGSEVGYMQFKGCTGLQGTLQVAGSAELQVGLGDAETVVGRDHDIHPFAGLFA